MNFEPYATAPSARFSGRPCFSGESGFSQVIEALPIALVLTHPDGVIEVMNRQAERMFALQDGDVRSQTLDVLVPERFRGRLDLSHGMLSNVSSPVMGKGWDLMGLRNTGAEFPLEIDLNPIDLNGQPMLLVSMTDISMRRQTEYEKGEKQRELERSNADLEDFGYAASHDLKAPLRAISHLVEWIAEDVGATASAETAENLRLLRGRVARLQLLLDGLLEYSLVGRGNRATVEDVDITDVVSNIVTMIGPPAGFGIVCECDVPVIRTHRAAIELVLRNLIDNGLKHHDRAEGCITITLRRVDGVPQFRVSDDGPGIPTSFHERIFMIFQTLASRDDVESSGLGLAIVKKRVLHNGGQIWVESAPPARGSTFVFTWDDTAS